eukprot:TRINITY_DN2529_c0_g1_i1.p1 TRINITY_DN2529_c0_g1~~TRINITY_DN2529_c0_g1_i1.p1  ORF type:complete len:336 (+),score=72.24 TRINITY_DN2529_c0_g1_i1:39-1046(+)
MIEESKTNPTTIDFDSKKDLVYQVFQEKAKLNPGDKLVLSETWIVKDKNLSSRPQAVYAECLKGKEQVSVEQYVQTLFLTLRKNHERLIGITHKIEATKKKILEVEDVLSFLQNNEQAKSFTNQKNSVQAFYEKNELFAPPLADFYSLFYKLGAKNGQVDDATTVTLVNTESADRCNFTLDTFRQGLMLYIYGKAQHGLRGELLAQVELSTEDIYNSYLEISVFKQEVIPPTSLEVSYYDQREIPKTQRENLIEIVFELSMDCQKRIEIMKEILASLQARLSQLKNRQERTSKNITEMFAPFSEKIEYSFEKGLHDPIPKQPQTYRICSSECQLM